jgi:hypothetical protein
MHWEICTKCIFPEDVGLGFSSFCVALRHWKWFGVLQIKNINMTLVRGMCPPLCNFLTFEEYMCHCRDKLKFQHEWHLLT